MGHMYVCLYVLNTQIFIHTYIGIYTCVNMYICIYTYVHMSQGIYFIILKAYSQSVAPSEVMSVQYTALRTLLSPKIPIHV
jgi:hypothetical protein